MLTDYEIRGYWGDSLTRVLPSKKLDELLPLDTLDFLYTVGLPLTKSLKSAPRLGIEFLSDLQVIHYLGETYVAIGTNKITQFCLQGGSGKVYSIEEQTQIPISFPVRFVNSDIRRLLMFLQIYLTHMPSIDKNTANAFQPRQGESIALIQRRMSAFHQEHSELISRMKLQLSEVDPPAMINDDTNWWAVVLDEITHGLM